MGADGARWIGVHVVLTHMILEVTVCCIGSPSHVLVELLATDFTVQERLFQLLSFLTLTKGTGPLDHSLSLGHV